MTTKEKQIARTKYDLYYESRMTKMETISEQLTNDIKEIKTDLRWLLGIVLGFDGIFLALLAKGFHWF